MNKKHWLVVPILFILSGLFVTWGIVQTIFSISELSSPLKVANVTKMEVALNLYGKELDHDKFEALKALDTKYISEDNDSASKENLIMMLTLASFSTMILSVIYFRIISRRKEAQRINQARKSQQDYLAKYNVGNDVLHTKCLNSKTYNVSLMNGELMIWYDNDKINIINCEFTNDIGKIEIDINNIICFLRYGDFYTSSNIKGGDSSFGRAALGYLIAGGSGAIIASRNPIVSSTEVHDKRETLLIIKEDDVEKFLFFEPELYDYLMHLIPNKEINYRMFSARN